MTSMIPCLKPFVAGLDTGYGSFDTERVTTQVQNSYSSNHYARKSRLPNLSSNIPINFAFNSTTGPGRLSQAISVTRGMELSNDSQQLIIRKDSSWEVVYSDT